MEKEKTKYMDMDTLVQSMQKTDNQYKKVSRGFQVMFFIFIFFYGGLFLVNPDSDLTINDRIAGGCYVVAFTFFTIIFRKNYKKYKEVNYSDSVKNVLESAEKRYRFWQKDIFLTVSAILFLDAATCLVLIPKLLSDWEFWNAFIVIQLVLFLSIGIGFTIGFIKWKKKFKPIWLSAKALLKDLEE